MKELSTEEKAKRYDNIIEKANKMHHENCEACQICIEELIPELKESENEMIRKVLLDFLKDELEKHGDEEWDGCFHTTDMIAWLEKQGNLMDALQEANKKIGELVEENYYLKEQGEQKPQRMISAEAKEDMYDKPVWSEEDSIRLQRIIDFLWHNRKGDTDGIYQQEQDIDWLKSLKDRIQPKQEWKQENTGDLTDFENVMMHIGNSFFGKNAGLDPNDTNVIKEQANLLLELIPSKEWSEEDSIRLRRIIDFLWHNRKGDTDTIYQQEQDIEWLKSLRPQKQWKPSDLPHWKKSTLPNDNTTGFNSDYFCHKGYNINYKELFEKLPKDD